MGEPSGQVFACSNCPWHSIPGDFPPNGACPECGEFVIPCQCDTAALLSKRQED